jgi:hypothetical protein
MLMKGFFVRYWCKFWTGDVVAVAAGVGVVEDTPGKGKGRGE